MANFSTLQRRMEVRARLIEQAVLRIQRKAATAIHRSLAENTPVDEGVAISNMFVTLGAPPPRSKREAYAPGKHGSTRGANIAATIDQGERAIESHTEGPINITNDLDYLPLLNRGWSSQQSDPGYLQRATIAALVGIGAERVLR